MEGLSGSENAILSTDAGSIDGEVGINSFQIDVKVAPVTKATAIAKVIHCRGFF